LEGAFTRATHAARVRHLKLVAPPEVPFYEGPARDPHGTRAEGPATPGSEACESNEFIDVEGAVLDPIALYAEGEDTLRQKLGLLSARHLCGIARGYHLVPDDFDLESFTEPEIARLIISGVRGRCAA
jgi:hypothetical protein